MKYLFIIAGVLLIALTIAAGLIWVERRLLSVWQDRLGPNRVGPFGLFQVIADTIKLFFKEDWVPPFSDRACFCYGSRNTDDYNPTDICSYSVWSGFLCF